jgi:hypothetical protein
LFVWVIGPARIYRKYGKGECTTVQVLPLLSNYAGPTPSVLSLSTGNGKDKEKRQED